MNLAAFITARRPAWKEIEALLNEAERQDITSLGHERARRLVDLYRRASADLIQARTYGAGVELVRYLETLGRSMAENGETAKLESRRAALQRAFAKIRAYEESLSMEMLQVLSDCGAVVYGVSDKRRIGQRVPTVCFNLPGISPARVSEELAGQNIGIRDGHMYSPRLMGRLGLARESGAVRASLVHYNTVEEVRRFGIALAEISGD